MDENRKPVKNEFLMWPAPQGVSASEGVSEAARINNYLATTKMSLADGIEVLPNTETVKMILQSWDLFKLCVAVSSDSYIARR
tara:strand:+ start:1270 stop:1518 length:249 start_codon:yes stop_codon:yes gene_type:complete